ncbi:MAG: WecB/TagA/CpsF family glycosyltransferase [Burkholderiales bacterium]|nr:WecB/TagA/CpsF family glycosyltransferase [Burkholderiales bacterium]
MSEVMKQNNDGRRIGWVLGAPIDALTWTDALARLTTWGAARESRYVCICNVHSVVTARESAFGRVLNEADLCTPDGAPVAWMLRRLGFVGQDRINGPDLMWKYLAVAEARGQVVSFYGGSDATLGILLERIRAAFPRIHIGVAISPPFRALTVEEDAVDVKRINDCGTAVLFVGLGCPKQETWMMNHRGQVFSVMVGVGAAFDYHAGTIQRAPLWMQRSGLEWLHRLASEPRRLWRRYLVTNSIFMMQAARQLLWPARQGPAVKDRGAER